MGKLTRLIHDISKNFKILEEVSGASVESSNLLKKSTTIHYENYLESLLGYSSRNISVHYPEVYRYVLRNCYIVGQQGFVFTSRNKIVSDQSEFIYEKKRKIRFPIPLMAKKVSGIAFHLAGKNYENHGHFVSQFLPRLIIEREYLLSNPKVKVILSKGQSSWQKRYLNMLGISTDRIIETDYGTIQIEKLIYIPFFHGTDSLVSNLDYKKLIPLFNAHKKSVKKTKKNVIFLSRENAPNRRIINEEEVIKLISKIMKTDVAKIFLEEFSLKQQIELFNNSNHIFGAQGQAFIGCLFSRNACFTIMDNIASKKLNRDWTVSFRNLSIHSENMASRLYADTKLTEDRSWVQPLKPLSEHLEKLQDLQLL